MGKDPILYITQMRKAWQEDDENTIKNLEENYGQQIVTLKDLEEVAHNIMSSLMMAYMEKDLIDSTKFDILLDVLVEKEVIEQRELIEIVNEIEELETKLEGED